MKLFARLAEDIALPLAANPESARSSIDRLVEAARLTDDQDLISFFDEATQDPRGQRILEGILSSSPYLTLCAERDPRFFRDLLEDGPDAAVAAVMTALEEWRGSKQDDTRLARNLRISKRRIALSVALADITRIWELERVTTGLSDFAEAALRAATAHLLRGLERRGTLRLKSSDDPEQESGFIVIAMGKLGARELNFSSDIDLIVLFNPERIDADEPEELQNHFVRMTRNLVKLIDERTVDGYVFRTDLRLRPDPSSTPLALSTFAAETYYESVGQNWERAAMIKARPVAGDTTAGREFLAHLKPFIWRKYLDFASIRDVHAIKRQINAYKGGSTIRVGGHNIKLGRGGIREIEFFAQTQQLIWGGREPKLRVAATEEAITALASHDRTTPETASDLITAYHYLRRLEHRLQMINDEQTQTLPEDVEGLKRIAVFMGYPDTETFSADLLEHLRKVEFHYADLFGDSTALESQDGVDGNLVFTGSDPDPETLQTLERLGYENAATVDRTVRGWHHARYRATSTTRAREILTDIMTVLLKALADTPNPDDAFLKFDEFLAHLPAGVQLFSMIETNPHLLVLLAEIMGTAPRLAEHLSRRSTVLEGVLSSDFTAQPSPETLDEELDRLLAQAEVPEDVLDFSRRWANDRKFQIGVQSLRGHLEPRLAAQALSNIAETALSRLHPRVEDDFATRHGRFPGHGMVVIALGKLGGAEMTPASDLDMIFVYESGGAENSDGEKSLVASQYFARLSQRLINAVTAQTTEGTLYEVDMRLRPSGKTGPIAVTLEGFAKYQKTEAWTWEHMALTRGRVLSGPSLLREEVSAVIHEVLTAERDPDKLLRDVANMRARMDTEHHTDSIWEIKHYRGGLIDVEFLAQYLQLRHAHVSPEVLSQNTRTALTNLAGAGHLDGDLCRTLVEALDLWQAVQGMLRLTIPGYFTAEREHEVPQALREKLARLGNCPDLPALKEEMLTYAEAVCRIFRDMIEME